MSTASGIADGQAMPGREHPPAPTSSAQGRRPPDDTLAALLYEHRLSWSVLHDRYGPLLELVRTLLGVVPNCDRYLEIWPPGFRTYNVLVPNFLNLPISVLGLGGAPAHVVGLGMYVVSRVAECPYCSAHACSFALRRGASPEQMAEALLGGGSKFDRGELATIAVARALGRIPCELTRKERDALIQAYGPDKAEWIVLGMVMMGFLNKFMNAIGVELEGAVVGEVSPLLGSDWSPGKAGFDLDPAAPPKAPPRRDSLSTKLRLVPMLPRALLQDKRWQAGVPTRWPAVGHYLRERTGHDFPVLSKLRHGRAVQSLATMLRENLDPDTTQVGLRVKVLAGVVFAEVVADPALAQDVRALAQRNGVTDTEVDEVARFALSPDASWPGAATSLASVLVLARAASHSPAQIDAETVTAVREGGLSPAAIVELVGWLSVLQMLHRLTCYYEAGNAAEPPPLDPSC